MGKKWQHSAHFKAMAYTELYTQAFKLKNSAKENHSAFKTEWTWGRKLREYPSFFFPNNNITFVIVIWFGEV